jgi:hypothetical protein
MNKFLELAKKSEKLQEELTKLNEELQIEMKTLAVGQYVQDPETLAVYKIIVPTGTFVSFKPLDYKRTNIEGEKGGGPSVLAKKEAEEAGFVLKK